MIKKAGLFHSSILLFFVFIQLIFIQCASSPQGFTINSNEIRDYICTVNLDLHPNIDRYLKLEIVNAMDTGRSERDNHAASLEAIRRGGFGTGFVYVDSGGRNFIITNYHVIAGAYRFSVTFEREDEEKIVFYNLSVHNVNEQGDIAILAFPEGVRPFRRGINISTSPLRSGTEVHAAGYPGLNNIPVWNFSTGSVLNPRLRPPGMEEHYVQHSAAINHGNSGGPLLVRDTSTPLGYSIVGINTFYISNMQGANFSITSENILSFIRESFRQVNELEALQNRVQALMALLTRSRNQYVYAELSSFLSIGMIARDPIGAFRQIPQNGPEELRGKLSRDPVTGIAWAVAYNDIEMYTYRRNQNVQPELLSIGPNNFGGYTVRFLISNYPYRSEWVWEHGTWKLGDFYEDDGEYNDYPHLATPHPLGKRIIYSIASYLDYDWYVLDIPRPGRLTVRTEGRSDPYMSLYYDPFTQESAERTLIAQDDDSGTEYNARISENVRAGKVYVRVIFAPRAVMPVGEYSLIAQLD
ncbi:MAG: serine protease [Treponema sp.]|nr:serine protease [Treponema sp.]